MKRPFCVRCETFVRECGVRAFPLRTFEDGHTLLGRESIYQHGIVTDHPPLVTFVDVEEWRPLCKCCRRPVGMILRYRYKLEWRHIGRRPWHCCECQAHPKGPRCEGKTTPEDDESFARIAALEIQKANVSDGGRRKAAALEV